MICDPSAEQASWYQFDGVNKVQHGCKEYVWEMGMADDRSPQYGIYLFLLGLSGFPAMLKPLTVLNKHLLKFSRVEVKTWFL